MHRRPNEHFGESCDSRSEHEDRIATLAQTVEELQADHDATKRAPGPRPEDFLRALPRRWAFA